jgi:hypothetical protein
VMPPTSTRTDFLAIDHHGSGDSTSSSIRVASRCDMASLPAPSVPARGPEGGAPDGGATPWGSAAPGCSDSWSSGVATGELLSVAKPPR